MSERMTVGQFIEFLSNVSSGAPDSAWIRLNGEYVDEMSMQLQRPLAEELEPGGPAKLKEDRTRRPVLDVLANGREAEELPVLRIS